MIKRLIKSFIYKRQKIKNLRSAVLSLESLNENMYENIMRLNAELTEVKNENMELRIENHRLHFAHQKEIKVLDDCITNIFLALGVPRGFIISRDEMFELVKNMKKRCS